MPVHILNPGNVLITREPMQVATVLGSCVAVCLHCARTQDAAICHALLPRPGANYEREAVAQHQGRYVSEILPYMLHHFARQGCATEEIVAKVFGGASITPKRVSEELSKEIGVNNVAEVFKILLEAKLLIRATITGGKRGHHIIFNTGTGEILHRLLNQTATNRSFLHG